jgi:hypothetical protein
MLDSVETPISKDNTLFLKPLATKNYALNHLENLTYAPGISSIAVQKNPVDLCISVI